MANYRQIHTQIWRDNWFLELRPDEKLLFIYLFSNDNSNLAGIYEIHESIIALETVAPTLFELPEPEQKQEWWRWKSGNVPTNYFAKG